MKPCLECGFEPAATEPGRTPPLIRRLARLHRAWLTGSGVRAADPAPLRIRPSEGTWSPLEYEAHVRDVFRLFDRRVRSILRAPGGELEVVDHDAAVVRGAYNRLAPGPLADEISQSADRLAETLERVRPREWSLSGFRCGEPRTIGEIAKRAVHEGRHHLMDVRRTLAPEADVRP